MLATLVDQVFPPANPWRTDLAPGVSQPRRVRGLQLAPGVWILRTREWVHAAFLDTHSELPAPIVDPADVAIHKWPVPEWHEWALCGGLSFAAFFGAASDDRPTMKRSEISYARGICSGCPVKRDCLDWALGRGEAFGVWGGTSGRQRSRMQAEIKGGVSQARIVDEWFGRWLTTT